MSYRLIAAAAALVALQGCARTPPAASGPTEDLNVGIAQSCTASPIKPVPGGTASATIAMTNDGWCAVRTTEADGQPFLLGLVRQRPEHGELLVRSLGGETRLEYNPHTGYTGADAFSVALRSRGASTADALVTVAVTVTRGAGVAAAAPEEETKPAATTTRRSTSTPARRTTRRSSH